MLSLNCKSFKQLTHFKELTISLSRYKLYNDVEKSIIITHISHLSNVVIKLCRVLWQLHCCKLYIIMSNILLQGGKLLQAVLLQTEFTVNRNIKTLPIISFQCSELKGCQIQRKIINNGVWLKWHDYNLTSLCRIISKQEGHNSPYLLTLTFLKSLLSRNKNFKSRYSKIKLIWNISGTNSSAIYF